mgnify:CR=1 FL=1
MALDDVYTEVLGEHSRNPDHKHHLSCATCALKGHNPSCGDEITIELQIENGTVKEAAFTGIGCAISQASTDIMAELIRGKSVEEARRLAHKFISMIKGEITDEDELEELDEVSTSSGFTVLSLSITLPYSSCFTPHIRFYHLPLR